MSVLNGVPIKIKAIIEFEGEEVESMQQALGFNSAAAYEQFKHDYPEALKNGDFIVIGNESAGTWTFYQHGTTQDQSIVTITDTKPLDKLNVTIEAEDESYFADKSASEIYTAFTAGKIVEATYNGSIYRLDNCTNSTATFVSTTLVGNNVVVSKFVVIGTAAAYAEKRI